MPNLALDLVTGRDTCRYEWSFISYKTRCNADQPDQTVAVFPPISTCRCFSAHIYLLVFFRPYLPVSVFQPISTCCYFQPLSTCCCFSTNIYLLLFFSLHLPAAVFQPTSTCCCFFSLHLPVAVFQPTSTCCCFTALIYLLLLLFLQFDHGLDGVASVQEHPPVGRVRQELVGQAHDVATEQHHGVGYQLQPEGRHA